LSRILTITPGPAVDYATSVPRIVDGEKLSCRSPRIVVAGHGRAGSILVMETGRFFCHAPVVEMRSRIGAGDALLGALTLSLSRGEPPQEALRWGVAAAAATVRTEGTALCDLAAVGSLLPECRLERL